jgi:signal transduction histidine kinase
LVPAATLVGLFLLAGAPPVAGDTALMFKAAGGLIFAGVIFIGCLWLTHKMFQAFRREAQDNATSHITSRPSDPSAFVMATYQGVIQQMREQEKELERLHRMERQRAEESQQLAATIMKNMATGLVMLNARGLITESNPAAKGTLGHQVLTGRDYKEVFWPGYHSFDTLPEGMVAVNDCLSTGNTVRRMTLNYTAPNGQIMVLGIGFSPIRAVDGAIGGAIMLLTDLTEITALQQQVRLKENMAALGEMAAGIAHEFKNALATISGYAQLIPISEQDEGRGFAQKIFKETQLLAAIVTDFLNFSRPLNMMAAPLNTRELIESSFDEILERGQFADVVLELTGEFPVVRGDVTLLRQAFSNLLRNGCEAMSETDSHPKRLQVEGVVEKGETGQQLRIDFHDEGCGISAENMDRVFIPFFTTKNTGTGLGLALVHKIVVNHNGKVTVGSIPGVGTTFSVTLPLHK